MNHREAGKLGYAKSRQACLKRAAENRCNALKRWNGASCPRCGKAIPYAQRRNRFCSHTCAAVFNNHNRSKATYCALCGKQKGRMARRFCSYGCAIKARWKQRVREIDISGLVPNSRVGRRFLAERYGWCCSICKLEHWQEKPTPLVLDHIDGNATNWCVSNLRLVCPNCDALLPTYKGRNRGKGRHARRQRYHDGKSY